MSQQALSIFARTSTRHLLTQGRPSPQLIWRSTTTNPLSSSSVRCMSSMASSSSTNNNNNNNNYQSPYAEIFTMMEQNQSSIDPITSTTTARNKRQTSKTTPNTPPTLKCGIPENVLRFTTVNYGRLILPPYTQPNEYKVTLRIALRHIPLSTPLEKELFFQIVQNRYVKEREELRLASKEFASRIENKRHLCAMLDRIVLGVKRLAKEIEEAK